MEKQKKMSHAYMRTAQDSNGISLNECLHPQRYYVTFEIKDPEDRRVCEVAMSHDQFVRLMLGNSDVPVTLRGYREVDGKWTEEVVEKPESVQDRMVDRIGEAGNDLKGRIEDLRKDLYETVNSPKVGKEKMKQLLHDIQVIESHFNSNYPYFVQCAAEEVADIQENAKSQLMMFANQHFGVDMKAGDFSPLIEGKNVLALPDKVNPIIEGYEPKERAKKSLGDMTAMEVGDAISQRLRAIEVAENKAFEQLGAKAKEEHRNLYQSGASAVGNGKVSIHYISYQGSHTIDLEIAKKYLTFLQSVKKLGDFKTDYWFEKS